MPGAPSRCGANRGGIAPRFYTTDFNLTENPLSEGGAWESNGSLWTPIATSNGFAKTTQDGTGTPSSNVYNDSVQNIAGSWPSDHRVVITLHRENNPGSGGLEIEALLRWKVESSTSTRGYECLINWNLNIYGPEIVRWNGPYGSPSGFTYIAQLGWTDIVVQDGDVWDCKIVGNDITVALFRSGSLVRSATRDIRFDKDGAALTPWTDGKPGLGLFRNNHGLNPGDFDSQYFCASNYTAYGL